MSSIVYLFKKWDKESWNNRKKHSESCRTSLYKTFCCCFSGEEKKSDFFRISFLNEWYGSTSHSVRSIIYTFYETKHKLLADSLSSHFWSPNGFWIWNSRIKKTRSANGNESINKNSRVIRMYSWVNHSSHNNTINIRFLKTSIDDMKVGKSVIRKILSLIFAGVLERSPRRRIFQYE